MGVRTLLVLLLIVGGLGAVLLLTDEKPKPKDTAEIAVLDGGSLRDGKRIWWQFENTSPIEISRAVDGGFRISEPIVDAVSPGYLKQIVDTFDSAQMRATPIVLDDEGRKKAGLVPPPLRIIVELTGDRRFEMEVGAPGPLGSTRFVALHGKIWEASDAIYESLRVGIEDLRDHAVFRNQAANTNDLSIEMALPSGKRETIHLQQQNGEWWLLAPRKARADPLEAQRFLVSVMTLRVDDFAPGEYRLPKEDPAIVIIARGALGEETVKLWYREGSVFGALPNRNNIVFSSDNRQYGLVFENAIDRLRARILVPMGSVYEQMLEAVVDPGQGHGPRLRLVRENSSAEWRIVEPIEFGANPTAVNELLQAINNLYAKEFVEGENGGQASADDPRFGLVAGRRLVLTVRGEDRKPPVVLWFGDDVKKDGAEAETVFACRPDDPAGIVQVPKKPVDMLRRAWVDYAKLQVVGLGNVPVEQVVIAHRTKGETRTFANKNGTWFLEGSDTKRNDIGGLANDVLRDFAGKRPIDTRGEAFRVADWTLVLARANGDALARLQVFEPSADAPLVVRNENAPVGYELTAFLDKQLRELWK